MYFDDINEIENIAKKTNFSIFAIPKNIKINIKNARILEPDPDGNKITVDMIRDFVSQASSAEKSDQFFIVYRAETMNENAENAFLKNLEEPKDFCHFILVTETPSSLLKTILSRAQVFYLREKDSLSSPIDTDEKIKTYARDLITKNPVALIPLATELSKKKDNARSYTLEIISTAIEISYKSYFQTNNIKFLQKLPNLIKMYDNINKNGNIKLHIVADML